MITAEQIQNANKTISPTDIHGKDYAEVPERIKAFRSICPNGSIQTEIISLENGVVTMKSTVLDEEGRVLATGMAQEKEGSNYINKTSFIENCETSSVGRALGMCGLGVDMSVASALEVANAINNQSDNSNNQQNKSKKQTAKTDEQKNQEMIKGADVRLLPTKDNVMSNEQYEYLMQEIERTDGMNDVMEYIKKSGMDDLTKIKSSTCIALLDGLKKRPTKEHTNG